MAETPRLHILDSTLIDKRGHHFEYDKSIVEEWVSRGLPAQVHCNRLAEDDIVLRLGAKRTFTRDSHTLFSVVRHASFADLLSTFVMANLEYFRDLRKAGRATFRRNDLALVHTIDPNQLFGLSLWHRLLEKESRPHLVILLRYDLGIGRRMGRTKAALYRSLFFLASGRAGSRIRFATDSELLAEEYGRIGGPRFLVLPIPHLPDPGPGSARRSEGPITLTYLGDARPEKGYGFLAHAVSSIVARRDDVRFVIQSTTGGDVPAEIAGNRERLASFGDRVVLIDRPLESEEYYRILRESDAVLLPYSADVYRGRTSGILAEAIAFGKPVIVTAGTWLARKVSEYGGCGVVFDRFDAAGFTEAIDAYLDDREGYARRAREASERWRSFHNPRTFVDMLIGAMAPGA